MRKYFSVIHNKNVLLAALYVMVIAAGLARTYYQTAVKAFSMATGKKVILIDAGHGGRDSGKVSEKGDLEKDINMLISDKLEAYLELSGAFTVTTRSVDTALGTSKRADLRTRVSMISELGADIMVSIHQNSFPQRNVSGAQVFYYGESDDSQRLAETIQKTMEEQLNPDNHRLAKPNLDYYILKNAGVPAVIVECGFMSNPGEMTMLRDGAYQDKVAWAIYCGIVDYFGGEGANPGK